MSKSVLKFIRKKKKFEKKFWLTLKISTDDTEHFVAESNTIIEIMQKNTSQQLIYCLFIHRLQGNYFFSDSTEEGHTNTYYFYL